MNCASGLQYDAGLCYKSCGGADYQGIGPVCWQNCPKTKYECGALCIDGGALECTAEVLEAVKDVVETALDIAEAAETGGANFVLVVKDVAELAEFFIRPIC